MRTTQSPAGFAVDRASGNFRKSAAYFATAVSLAAMMSFSRALSVPLLIPLGSVRPLSSANAESGKIERGECVGPARQVDGLQDLLAGLVVETGEERDEFREGRIGIPGDRFVPRSRFAWSPLAAAAIAASWATASLYLAMSALRCCTHTTYCFHRLSGRLGRSAATSVRIDHRLELVLRHHQFVGVLVGFGDDALADRCRSPR